METTEETHVMMSQPIFYYVNAEYYAENNESEDLETSINQ